MEGTSKAWTLKAACNGNCLAAGQKASSTPKRVCSKVSACSPDLYMMAMLRRVRLTSSKRRQARLAGMQRNVADMRCRHRS